MRRFGRPVGNTDSLSFLYYNDTRNKRNEEYSNGRVGAGNFVTGDTHPVVVDKVEMYAVENSNNHHTDKYEQVTEHKVPVLRRSAMFYLALHSRERPIEVDRDKVKLIFEFGQYPSVPKGTKVVLLLTDKSQLDNNKTKWDTIVHRPAGQNLILQVQIGSGSPVGIWKCKVETSSNRAGAGTTFVKTYIEPTPIYILFNPYNQDDTVYMPNTSELSEYVENDVGKIWKGGYKQVRGRQWIFGQFEDTVLPAVCFVLDRAGLKPAERGNPVRVSRAISAVVNSVDDDGVVKGRWRAPYEGGTAPWDWKGSVKILEKYMEGNGEPVKYGQCWVYSGVTVTICRALGLPCRSVTNYVSAHDTNHSLTIDKFFSEDGDELTSRDNPEFGYDSIWNFHVWNDVWMARPDLPTGYGGWQAIDATPQEASENVYQCGPAPVEAVRRGEIGLGFDVPFLFAEVNADICHFVKDDRSHWGFKRSKMNKYHVGRLVLTKSIGPTDNDSDRDAEDITWQYKNEEGSVEERLAVYNAVRGVDKAVNFYELPSKEQEDVVMDLVDLETVNYGDAFKARVILENKSNEQRTLKALLSSSSIFYTGITANLVKKAQGEFVLGPRQRDTLALTVFPSDYMGKLVDYTMMKIYSLIKVKETNQTWSEEDDFVLEKPKLKVEVPSSRLVIGRLGQVRLSFTNPLEVPLSRCHVSVECAGAVREVKERIPNDIEPKAQFTHNVLVLPRKVGHGTLVASFGSEEMIDVYGSCKVEIMD